MMRPAIRYAFAMDSPLSRIDGYRFTVGPPDRISEVTGLIRIAETAVDGSSAATDSFVTMLIDTPETDPNTDVLSVRRSDDGDLVGFGRYLNTDPHIESVTLGWVHPQHRGRGIGSAIITWGIELSRSLIPLAPSDARITNRCQASQTDPAAIDLFIDHGYRADRHEFEMHRTLDAPVEVTDLPDDVAVRTMAGAEDLGMVTRVITAAFKDHYGWVDSTPEASVKRWSNYRAMDEWDDDLVWIAETPDGAVGILAGLTSHGSHTDAGYVGSLGVVREWRGKGIARALLTRAFAEYHQRGKLWVALDVDADSLTGATRLYESVGMHRVRTEISYLIELRPGTDLVVR